MKFIHAVNLPSSEDKYTKDQHLYAQLPQATSNFKIHDHNDKYIHGAAVPK